MLRAFNFGLRLGDAFALALQHDPTFPVARAGWYTIPIVYHPEHWKSPWPRFPCHTAAVC